MTKLNKIKSGSLVRYEVLVEGVKVGMVQKLGADWISYSNISDTKNRNYANTRAKAVEMLLKGGNN